MQLAAGAAVVLVAVLAATLPGVAKSAMLDWKQWGKPEKTGTSVGFIWDHTYAGLKRPKKPVTLLRVTADSPSYWRAVVLGKFDGSRGCRAERRRHRLAADGRGAAGRAVAGRAAACRCSRRRSSSRTSTSPRATWSRPSRGAGDQGRRRRGGADQPERGRDVLDRQERARRLELDGRLRAGAADDQAAHASRRPTIRRTSSPSGLTLLSPNGVEFPAWGTPDREAQVDRPPQRGLLRPAARALARRVRHGQEDHAGRDDAVRRGGADRVVLPEELHVRREGRLLAAPRRPAAVLLPGRQARLLPDVRRAR